MLAHVTWARAAWISGLVAISIHMGALDNEWTFDDLPIVRENVNARSVDAALDSFFDPYWAIAAGQYRPAIILSYAVDRELNQHNPVWSHGVNVVLHGVVTALFVIVLMAWLTPVAGLAAGLVFAVHPVHVEAVAGVVGRAELVVAVLLLGAILSARQYRAAQSRPRRAVWLYITLAQVLWALLSKEHAIVAVALLALDEITTGRLNLRRNLALYVGVLVVSLSWLTVFNAVAGEFVEDSIAVAIRFLGFFERLATMAPAQLHVVRLLVWPFDLAADYNPEMILRRTSWTWMASLGTAVVLSITALSVALFKTRPVVTFGVWMAIITYSPTSNILFGSGIILSERNLYLAAGAVAIAVGVIVQDGARLTKYPLIGVGALVVVAIFGWKTVDRVPAWKDTATLVVEDVANHLENYRARLRLAVVLRESDRFAEAMAEATAAAAIFPADQFLVLTVVPHLLAMGHLERAAAEAEKAYANLPENTALARLAIRANLRTGREDSARALARRNVELWPDDPMAAEDYQQVVNGIGVSEWTRAFAEARVYWADRELARSSAALIRGVSLMPDTVVGQECWDVAAAAGLADRLVPELGPQFAGRSRACPAPAP